MLRGRLSSATGPIGVEFSTHAVRMVQLRERPDDLVVVGAAQVELPSPEDGESDSQQAHDESVDRLRRALRQSGAQGRRCVVSIPPERMHVQSVRLPAMSDRDLHDAVRWEAVERFLLERDASEVDFVRTGAAAPGSEKREEVLVVAASHAELLPRLQLVIDAGLQPVAVDTHFGAIARVFSRQCRRAADRDQVRAVLAVGEAGATALVLRGPELAFCKSVPIGTDHLDRLAAERLDIPTEAAGALRERRLLANWLGAEGDIDESADRAVFEAVRPQLEELVREFVLCLRYYGVTFRGRPPSCIYLAGCGGCEPRFDEMLSRACKIPVHRDDTTDLVRSVGHAIASKLGRDGVLAPRWEIATGLSLRALRAPATTGLAA